MHNIQILKIKSKVIANIKSGAYIPCVKQWVDAPVKVTLLNNGKSKDFHLNVHNSYNFTYIPFPKEFVGHEVIIEKEKEKEK